MFSLVGYTTNKHTSKKIKCYKTKLLSAATVPWVTPNGHIFLSIGCITFGRCLYYRLTCGLSLEFPFLVSTITHCKQRRQLRWQVGDSGCSWCYYLQKQIVQAETISVDQFSPWSWVSGKLLLYIPPPFILALQVIIYYWTLLQILKGKECNSFEVILHYCAGSILKFLQLLFWRTG